MNHIPVIPPQFRLILASGSPLVSAQNISVPAAADSNAPEYVISALSLLLLLACAVPLQLCPPPSEPSQYGVAYAFCSSCTASYP